MSEDRRDPMVQKLVASYDAEVQSASEIEDFNLLRASSNLVLSVSSYAWWAGWLSQASQIFFQWPVFSIKLGHDYDPWPGSRIFGSTTNHDMFRFDPLG